MPLLDHFRPPVKNCIQWNSFHANWATRIADRLVELVPDEFRVEEFLKSGGGAEIDVAAVTDAEEAAPPWRSDWQPSPAAGAMPVEYPDKYEVLVYRMFGGRQLVAAVELVSPGNKDRDESRAAFAQKVAAYLRQGVGVLVVDVVTERHANLHNDIVRLMGGADGLLLPAEAALYAAAYRPVEQDGTGEVQVWTATFAVGDPLPTMPLRLIADYFVPVELESSYTEARRRRKLD